MEMVGAGVDLPGRVQIRSVVTGIQVGGGTESQGERDRQFDNLDSHV